MSTLGILLAMMRFMNFMNFTYLFTYLLFAVCCLMRSRSKDAPKVNCSPTAAYLGDRNVAVGCTVRAKPPVTALFWIIDANGASVSNHSLLDANGTSVSEGDLIADHWTLESVCKQICVRHVATHSFLGCKTAGKFFGSEEQIWGSCLRYYEYPKMIVVEMVFVRFGKQRTIFFGGGLSTCPRP